MLKLLSISVVSLLVVIIAVVFTLLGTASGSGWLLRNVAELEIDNVEGSLLGHLQLTGIRYRDPSNLFEAETLVLDWQPSALFNLHVDIDNVSLENARYAKTAGADETGTAPASDEKTGDLPQVILPLSFNLGRLEIRQLAVETSDNAEPLLIEHAFVKANGEHSDIRLVSFETSVRDIGKLQSTGKVRLSQAYPLSLKNVVQLNIPDTLSLEIDGELSGDLNSLTIHQNTTGDINGRVEATLQDLLNELRWNARVNVSEVSQRIAGDELPQALALALSANGDLAEAAARLEILAPPRQATMDSEQAPGNNGPTLTVTGNVRFDDLRFDAKANWRELNWPLHGTSQFTAEDGRLVASGQADDYRFELDTNLSGAELPPGKWTASGTGSTEQVKLQKLHARLLDGELDIEGLFRWSPTMNWTARLDARNIDPSFFNAEFDGKLNLGLDTNGELKNGNRQIKLLIRTLSGTMFDRDVSGQGSIRITNEQIHADQLLLRSGDAMVSANGQLATEWDLVWEARIPDMSALLPTARGSVDADGTFSGSETIPRVQANIAISKLAYEGTLVKTLTAKIDADLRENQNSDIVIDASGLVQGTQQIDTLSLRLQGPPEKQRWQLTAQHPLGKLAADATGALELSGWRWSGQLQKLSLATSDWGNWSLKKAAAVDVSGESAKLSDLCLADDKAQACALLDWSPDGGNAGASLKNFELARLLPLLPYELTKLEGGIDAELAAQLGKLPTATLQLNITPGRLGYLVNDKQTIEVAFDGAQFDASYGQQKASGKLQLAVGDNKLNANFSVPRKSLDTDFEQAPLDGSIRLDLKQLGLISALVPAVEQSEGRILGDIRLSGSPANPGVRGELTLDMTQLSIPLSGLELNDLNIRVNDLDEHTLKITGSVTSGPGSLQLDGQLALDANKNWPLQLKLNGQNFQAVNLPEANVFISPELAVANSADGLGLTGSLLIPEAHIRLHELPASARSVSSDVVIVTPGDDTPRTTGTNIRTNLTVILGDNVTFRGFGLTADLGGKLTVTQQPGELAVGNGEIGIDHGTYSYGQRLTIEQGKIFYAGGALNNPGLYVRAKREVDDVTVGVNVTGTLKKPVIRAFSSDPRMTENDARSMLLLGTTQSQASSGKGSLYAGKQITDELSVGTNVSLDDGETEFVSRYRINKNWSVRGTTSSSSSGAEALYTIEFE